jgi:hypothetical protein
LLPTISGENRGRRSAPAACSRPPPVSPDTAVAVAVLKDSFGPATRSTHSRSMAVSGCHSAAGGSWPRLRTAPSERRRRRIESQAGGCNNSNLLRRDPGKSPDAHLISSIQQADKNPREHLVTCPSCLRQKPDLLSVSLEARFVHLECRAAHDQDSAHRLHRPWRHMVTSPLNQEP